MYTSSPLPALCLLLALGSAAPVINDPEVIARGIFWDDQATDIEKRGMNGALIPTPAPQPYEVDNYLPPRQWDDIVPGLGGVPGCEYTISPEGQSYCNCGGTLVPLTPAGNCEYQTQPKPRQLPFDAPSILLRPTGPLNSLPPSPQLTIPVPEPTISVPLPEPTISFAPQPTISLLPPPASIVVTPAFSEATALGPVPTKT